MPILIFAVAALLCAGGLVEAQTELPPTIPIFPLEVTMLFPGVSRPLHIFEPRYRAMVADALKGDRIIGMTTLKPGYEEAGSRSFSATDFATPLNGPSLCVPCVLCG